LDASIIRHRVKIMDRAGSDVTDTTVMSTRTRVNPYTNDVLNVSELYNTELALFSRHFISRSVESRAFVGTLFVVNRMDAAWGCCVLA